jgi:hypothetical protein
MIYIRWLESDFNVIYHLSPRMCISSEKIGNPTRLGPRRKQMAKGMVNFDFQWLVQTESNQSVAVNLRSFPEY